MPEEREMPRGSQSSKRNHWTLVLGIGIPCSTFYSRQFRDLFLHTEIATLTFQEGVLTFSVRKSISHQYIKQMQGVTTGIHKVPTSGIIDSSFKISVLFFLLTKCRFFWKMSSDQLNLTVFLAQSKHIHMSVNLCGQIGVSNLGQNGGILIA